MFHLQPRIGFDEYDAWARDEEFERAETPVVRGAGNPQCGVDD
jgi:hypothetical protein